MNIKELVEYLKTSLFIIDPETGNTINDDPEFVALSDSHLEHVLKVAMSNVNSRKSIEEIEPIDVYPVVLLARREIYYTLATKSAPLYDMSVAGSAGASSIMRNQRFNHYMKLVEGVNDEYKLYMSTGQGGRALQSSDVIGEVLLPSRYYTPRNYTLANKPTIKLQIDTIYPEEVEIHWKGIQVDRFKQYKIYLGEETSIIDKYGGSLIKKGSRLIDTITDFHIRHFRVSNLKPNTEYYIAIVIEELNGLKGYNELTFTTVIQQ